MREIKVIAFDADDTLWVNEPYFQETEHQFCALLEDFLPHHTVSQELFKTEMANLPLYGYGVKGFMLCMIETINRVTENKASLELVQKTLDLGKAMLQKPIVLLDGVEAVLKQLSGQYRVVMATKGDLLDQERKLIQSGLEPHFHHIEIMSNKESADYQKLLRHLDCAPEHFLMVGNSIKSDILPVLDLGGHAIHIPFHTTWAHEQVNQTIAHPHFVQAEKITEVLTYLN
jgi:putative hydrolase of the HAD superfamily